MRIIFNKGSAHEENDDSLTKNREITKKDYSQTLLKTQDNEEEPIYISFLWPVSFLLLITADALELLIGFLGIISFGVLSFLSFIPSIFEIIGAIFFSILILYYTKSGHINFLEGLAYVGIIIIEFFGFIPLIGSIIEIFPLKTISSLTARARLWRLRRLKEFKNKIQAQ